MTQRARLLINLAVVVLLGAVMTAWVLTQIVGPAVVKRPFTVTADFANTGGVFTNQEVTYRGVLVGRVGDLSLNDDGVDIELLIDSEWEESIPADTLAEVNSKSAVGEQYVNLVADSTPGGEFLSDGAVIERENTRLSVDVQSLLAALDRVLADVPPEQLSRVVGNLADGFGGRENEIAAILESLGTLSRSFAEVAPEQQRFLDNATRTGREFLASKDALTEAINAADDVFAGIGDEPEELRSLFAENDRLARAGIELLARRGRDLSKGIEALADFSTYQVEIIDVVKQALAYVPAFFGAIESSSIPWESPDGDTFYRIRAGLVIDNVRASWPCKYRLPEGYERHYFERTSRKQIRTDLECRPESRSATRRMTASLLDALRRWEQDNAASVLYQPDTSGLPVSGQGFIWPLSGPITSYFGPRWGRMHTGIDIDGTTGAPVVAAASGRVAWAGYYGGYGNAVVIAHSNGLSTL
ncbi:MAG: MCE family protein, partial [Actinomycetota bacterium]